MGAELASGTGGNTDTESHDESTCVDALWLATLHRIFTRAAHEVKGALNGVSAIVLDPNNDLSRLGARWPENPPGWNPADDERADAYFDNAEVVVWTPRVTAGRPLSFQPLPDFTSLRDWPDEFEERYSDEEEE